MDFDDDYLGTNDSTLIEDFDKMFKLSTIDRVRKLKITVKLVDKDNDEVPLKDIIQQLMSYLKDKTGSASAMDENNAILNKVMPLVSQACVAGLPKIAGPQNALIFLSLENIRYSMMMMMILSFSLMQFVKNKDLKIVTIEEPITDEEIESSRKLSKATSVATMGSLLGIPPEQIAEELLKSGALTEEEIDKLRKNKNTETDEDVFDDGSEDES